MVRKHLPLLVLALALATPVLPSPAGATTGGLRRRVHARLLEEPPRQLARGRRPVPAVRPERARAATAALLNADHPDLMYPLAQWVPTRSGPGIIPSVHRIWDSGDREAMLDLADLFDGYNNGECLLN